jgi:hypothetical protein
MRKIRPPRLQKPPKFKVFRPRVGHAGRASGDAGGSSTAGDDDTDDSSVYRAPTGSSQGQVGSADPASLTDQDNSDLVGGTQDYVRGGSVRASKAAGGNPAGDMGGSMGLSQPRRPR